MVIDWWRNLTIFRLPSASSSTEVALGSFRDEAFKLLIINELIK